MALGIIFVHQTLRVMNAPNKVDYLEELTASLINDIEKSKRLYYLSNNDSEEVYYRTQFVCVPNVVVKKTYEEIPANSLILLVHDLKQEGSSSVFNGQIPDTSHLRSQANSFFKIELLNKKQ